MCIRDRARAAAALPGQSGATGLAAAAYTAYKIEAQYALEPAGGGTQWTFDVPAMSNPPVRRRSELWWSIDGRPVSYGSTGYVRYQADIGADLGAAAFTSADWAVLWQLLGTTYGVWKAPNFAITQANGQLRLTGGSGHPNHDPNAGRNYWWYRDLAPYANWRSYRVRIESQLSTDPNVGWISVWVNGVVVVDRWRPIARSGLRPGTFHPGQTTIYSRSGLYRGTNGTAARPTYRQRSRHSAVVLS